METTPPILEPSADNPAPTTSLAARMFNVLATPGEVFAEVSAAKPSTANWLVPLLLTLVVGVVAVFVIYSQPAIIQQLHEQTLKTFDDQVKAGKMTRAQADQAEARAEKITGPTVLKFSGVLVVSVVVFARLFWWALVLWLLGRWFLKVGFSYQQALEVAGLALTLEILSGLVTMLLVVCLGKVTTLSLALCAGNADPQGLLHLVLSTVDFFDLWLVGVMASGLARLANVKWSKALSLTFGYWLVMECVWISIGWFSIALGRGFK